jgi:hypothetical protein
MKNGTKPERPITYLAIDRKMEYALCSVITMGKINFKINQMKKNKKLRLLMAVLIFPFSAALTQSQKTIYPGEIWPDSDGNHIQAHGGGIIKLGKTYYWYGEERRKGLDSNYRFVSCYASKDLVNWKFQGDAIKLSRPDSVLENRGWVLERPKVFYNKKTKKYVMYMHIDGKVKGENSGGYGYARVGVAVSDKAKGPFNLIKTFRPLGKESRDIGQFIDDDRSAYLIFESRPSKGFYIARLSDDYLNVEREVCFIQSPLEGGAIVHYQGLYYVIGSALTGWRPNPNKYSTATTLKGPWSEFKDIAPVETNTYGSQSTMLIKVEGTKSTTVIFLGDKWKPSMQWDSRYLWMPAQIGGGKFWLPEPRPWSLNVKTGEWKFVDNSLAKDAKP